MIVVRFKFSRANPGKGSTAQVHGQVHDVEVQGEVVTYQTLMKAQLEFLEWFGSEHPYAELIQWEAGSIDGDGFATYRAFLPVSTTRKA